MKKAKEEKRVPEKAEKPVPKKSGALMWVAVAAIIIIVIAAAAFMLQNPVTPQQNGFKPVKLELFVNGLDSKSQEAELTLKPVLEKFGSNVSLKMYFVVAFEGYAFRAQGGDAEVAEDAMQACAQKNYPNEFFSYVACRANGIDGKTCGGQTGVNYDIVSVCAQGKDGKDLLEESFRVASALRVSANFAPVLYVNTTLLQKPITTTSAMQAICSVIPAHSACAQVPSCSADSECQKEGEVGKCEDAGKLSAKCVYSKPETVNLTVFTDSKCGPCNAGPVLSVLRSYFKGLNVTIADYSTEIGASRARYFGLTGLPAFVFDKSVEKGEGYSQVKADLVPIGEFYLVSPTVVFSDKAGRGVASTIPSSFIQRQATNNSITLFTMGKCPASAVAAALVGDVVTALPKASLDVRFVVGRYSNNSLFAASPAELDEDARQACAFSLNSSAFPNYLVCSTNATIAWQDCAQQAGYNASRIAQCVSAESGALLAQSAEFVAQAGVKGAPALFINNQILLRDIPSAEKLKEWFCLANPGTPGCDAQLSNQSVMGGLRTCFVA